MFEKYIPVDIDKRANCDLFYRFGRSDVLGSGEIKSGWSRILSVDESTLKKVLSNKVGICGKESNIPYLIYNKNIPVLIELFKIKEVFPWIPITKTFSLYINYFKSKQIVRFSSRDSKQVEFLKNVVPSGIYLSLYSFVYNEDIYDEKKIFDVYLEFILEMVFTLLRSYTGSYIYISPLVEKVNNVCLALAYVNTVTRSEPDQIKYKIYNLEHFKKLINSSKTASALNIDYKSLGELLSAIKDVQSDKIFIAATNFYGIVYPEKEFFRRGFTTFGLFFDYLLFNGILVRPQVQIPVLRLFSLLELEDEYLVVTSKALANKRFKKVVNHLLYIADTTYKEKVSKYLM